MTNWSKPQRRRLVIVRRRIGTPPTGSSVFGVSSECGRSRVAQPAAKMTAFMRPACRAIAMRNVISDTYLEELFKFHQVDAGALLRRRIPVTRPLHRCH